MFEHIQFKKYIFKQQIISTKNIIGKSSNSCIWYLSIVKRNIVSVSLDQIKCSFLIICHNLKFPVNRG